METPAECAVPAGSLSVPFSLLFAQKTVPTREGDQTGGAETETQTSLDGIVKTDSEEDEDVDSRAGSRDERTPSRSRWKQKRADMRNVLILTRSPDPHMPPVAEAIRARGSGVVCFNLADFPEEVALQATLDGRQDGWSGSISYQEQHVPLDSLASIWWRRPKQYKAPATYSPGERTFLEEEANRGLIGVLESLALQQTLWVSRLHSIRRAELKPLQLAAAQQLGLRTPRTLLTNDPGAARAFYEACQGQVVLKAVSRGAIEEEERRFIYTSRVLPEHLASLEGVRATTHLFQEYLPKHLDVRVVVIGRQVFAAEIHSQHSERSRLDFRQGM